MQQRTPTRSCVLIKERPLFFLKVLLFGGTSAWSWGFPGLSPHQPSAAFGDSQHLAGLASNPVRSGHWGGSEPGGAQDQFIVLDPPQTEQSIGVVPKLGGIALQDLHFETEAVVEVNVQGREDSSSVGMAGFDQTLGKLALLVVIEPGEARPRRMVFETGRTVV